MRRRAVAAAAVPAVLAMGAYQADRYLRRKLAPAPRDMPHDPDALGLPAEEVWLESRAGTALHAWFAPPERSPAPTVVVLHGWGANGSLMLPIAPLLRDAGFGVVVGDARGHGFSESVEHVSLPRFADDLETFLDFAVGRPEVAGCSVIGHSVGAGAALLVASRRADVVATVAVGSFADPRELMAMAPAMQRLPEPLRRGVFRRMELAMDARFEEVSPIFTVGDALGPVMLVHGSDDPIIPRSDFDRLAEAAAPGTRVLLVEGGVHDRLDEYLPHVPDITTFLAAAHRSVGPPEHLTLRPAGG